MLYNYTYKTVNILYNILLQKLIRKVQEIERLYFNKSTQQEI